MDAFPNDIHPITRKRKADGDECSVQDPVISTESPPCPEIVMFDDSATPRMPTKAAESQSASWLLAQHHYPMVTPWQPPAPLSSPQVPITSGFVQEGPSRPKRPRIEIPECVPLSSRKSRRGRTPLSSAVSSPRRFSRHARAGALRDSGMVSAKEPGPSRSLLAPISNIITSHSSSYSAPASPIEPLPSTIPSHQPPINRETLKELDLDAILRNPQLRHDLLFDSGLQFRPTGSRRKRDMADKYWRAIERELDTGCTCVTVDANGKLRDRVCVCGSLPMPKSRSLRATPASGGFTTIRTPSRLKPLLCELLEVLISIIQPVVARSNSFNVPPGLLHPQYSQSTSHVAYLRSILDADFIQQEVDHNLFDPSGVFRAIGEIIRCYCAPMRDTAVDQMVKLAQSCSPGGTGTKADAVRAIRVCFEIMELMKLDVANHQLQTLRPYLNQSSAQFELKMFEESRQKGKLSLHVTRQWLSSAYSELVHEKISPSSDLTVTVFRNFARQSRHTQIQIAVTKALANLIFNPPSPSASASSSSHRKGPAAQPGYPETLYLDHSRLKALSTDASDFTAVYMLLMLYRQLVCTSGSPHGGGPIKLDELLAIKKEIWEIGPQHAGRCFSAPTSTSSSSSHSSPPDTPTLVPSTTPFAPPRPSLASPSSLSSSSSSRHSDKDRSASDTKWREELNNIILQLTTRAGDAQFRTRIPTIAPASSTSTATASSSSSTSLFASSSLSSSSVSSERPRPSESHTTSTSAHSSRLPDPAKLQLATSWADNNLRPNSPLGKLMRKRVHRLVEERALQIVLPSLTTPSKKSSGSEDSTTTAESERDRAVAASGLEPLMPEINHLAERLSKLVSIHMNVYGALYAQPEFLPEFPSASSSS